MQSADIDTLRRRSASTIFETLATLANEDGDAIVVASRDRGALSRSQLSAQLAYVAAFLRSRGIGRTDRVALVLPNGPEMAVAFLACANVAAAAPLNPNFTREEFSFYLEDLDARALLLLKGSDSPARSSASARGIQILEITLGSAPGSFTLDGGTPGTADATEAGHDDVALVLHTSGTTSRPKQVPLVHRQLAQSASNVAISMGLSSADRSLILMPLFHIHGLIGALLASLVSGGSVACAGEFRSDTFGSWIRETRPTWYSAVPTIHQSVLGLVTRTPELLDDWPLRIARSSSASLPKPVMEALEQTLKIPVVEAYGMTEAAHQMASNPAPPGVRKPGSVGPAAGPEVAIMGTDGALLPPDAVGEVVIRGPSVFGGYERNPDANRTAFSDGWFRTGDQGYLDSDGYLFLAGRLKEIINRGGEKISPLEVDNIVLTHPAIRQAVTFAVPHATLGEDVALAVVTAPGATISARDLREFLSGKIAEFKLPQQVIVLDALPKGPTGKLQRITLAETLKDHLKPPFVEPTSEIEKTVAALWRRYLGVDEVGIHDNFWALGGDSLQVVAIIAELRRHGLTLTPRQFMQTPTIAGLAPLISERAPATSHSVAPTGEAPVLPLQHFLRHRWFLEVGIQFEGAIDRARLQRAAEHVVRHHDGMRARIVHRDGRLLQRIPEDGDSVTIHEVSLASLAEPERFQRLASLLYGWSQQLDPETGPTLYLAIVDYGDSQGVICGTVHNNSDIISLDIVASDLATAYAQLGDAERPSLPEKTSSLRELALAQWKSLEAGEWDDEIPFWNRIHESLNGTSTGLRPDPVDGPGADQGQLWVSSFTLRDPDLIECLLTEAPTSFRCSPADILVAALARVLGKRLSTSIVPIGLALSGRTDIQEALDLSRTVGPFMTAVPLLVDIAAHSNAPDFVRSVRQQFDGMPARGAHWQWLTAFGKLEPPGAMPMMLNYLGRRTGTREAVEQGTCRLDTAQDTRFAMLVASCRGRVAVPTKHTAHLVLNVSFSSTDLLFSFTCDPRRYRDAALVTLCEELTSELRNLMPNSSIRNAVSGPIRPAGQ